MSTVRRLPAEVYDSLTTAYQHIDSLVIAQGIAEVQSRYEREESEPDRLWGVRHKQPGRSDWLAVYATQAVARHESEYPDCRLRGCELMSRVIPDGEWEVAS